MMLAKGYKAALMAGVAMLALAGSARAQNNTIQGWCQVGGIKAATQGMTSSNTLQGSYPRCSVTVYLTGTSTKATLHTSASGGTLTNPFTANTDGSWLLWAANGAYDVVMVGGTPIAMPYAVTLTDVVLGSGGGGGGGCSTGGIPTTNGIVDGDVTSTNCGTNNRASDTAGSPANVQTFGFTNGTGNSGTDVVLMGEHNGVGNQASDLVAIGGGNASIAGSATLSGDDIIAIGIGAISPNAGAPITASYGDVIGIGNGAGSVHNDANIANSIAIGDGAGGYWAGNTNNIVGIGNGGAAQLLNSDNVVGVGNGAASGVTPSGSPAAPTSTVTEVVGIGDGAAGNNSGSHVIGIGMAALEGRNIGGTRGNIGDYNIAVGDQALIANRSGTHNVGIGTNAGAIGWTGGGNASANVSGSNNTWIGDFSGPNTATQLSNTIAIGANASVSASNSATYGNSSITQTDIYGTTTIHGAGTINGLDVPGGTDATGTAGRYKLWASTPNGCWMITNGTGSPACISTGGGGGTPGGSNTQIQFNNSGAFGGSANFKWTGTSLVLPLDTVSAINAGSGTPDPYTTWNFQNTMTATPFPSSTYRQAVSFAAIPTLGADDANVHWSAMNGFAFPGDDHNYHTLFGGQWEAYTTRAGNIFEMDGGAMGAFHAGSGTVALQIGGKITSVAQSTGGITNNYGSQITTGNQGTGTIGTNYGIDVESAGSGPITTNYGIHIQPQTGGATNFNLFSAGATSHNTVEGDLKVGFGSTPSDVCTQAVPCAGGGGSNVTVNGGSTLSTANLNSTTPAATAGHRDVSFQASSANISAQLPEYGSVPVEDFGAVGDSNGTTGNGTNNTTAVQNCLNSLLSGSTISKCMLQAGKIYRITSTLTIDTSNVGIIGTAAGQGVSAGGSDKPAMIMIDSASANGLNVGCTAGTVFNTLENFTIMRPVLPTGTATAFNICNANGLMARHIQGADHIRGMAFFGGASYGIGAIENTQFYNGYNAAVTGYGSTSTYGYYLNSDNAHQFASLKFLQPVCAENSGDVNHFCFELSGTAINDVHVLGLEAATSGTCISVDYTGSGISGAAGAYDDHFWNSILQCHNAISVNNVLAAAAGGVEFTGGWIGGGQTASAVDIEGSSGVKISIPQIDAGTVTVHNSSNVILSGIKAYVPITFNNTAQSSISDVTYVANDSRSCAFCFVGSSRNTLSGLTLTALSGANYGSVISYDSSSNQNTDCGVTFGGAGTVSSLAADSGNGNGCYPGVRPDGNNGLQIGKNTGGVNNASINFGTNYGNLDIIMYDGGSANRYGWGLTGGTMNFVVPSLANSGGHVTFTDAGDLGAGQSLTYLMRDRLAIPSGSVFAFTSSTDAAGTRDTGLSRDAAGVVDCGNGTAGNKSCTFNAATGTFSSALTVGGNNVCQSTGTNCPSSGVATTVASSETVASSATPTFSTSFNVSYNVLTANVTTFTLAAGSDGQSKTLTFCQNGTGNFTVAPPANVHGFFTVGLTASKCSSQHFNYSTAQTAWLADSAGVVNE